MVWGGEKSKIAFPIFKCNTSSTACSDDLPGTLSTRCSRSVSNPSSRAYSHNDSHSGGTDPAITFVTTSLPFTINLYKLRKCILNATQGTSGSLIVQRFLAQLHVF